jgi:hypothetical protein
VNLHAHRRHRNSQDRAISLALQENMPEMRRFELVHRYKMPALPWQKLAPEEARNQEVNKRFIAFSRHSRSFSLHILPIHELAREQVHVGFPCQ